MALKPWTMSFKETEDEIKLHEILEKKTSPMAFAKDILIDVLVRGKYVLVSNSIQESIKKADNSGSNDELDEILGM